MYHSEDWKTDDMIRAEREFDDAVESAYRDMYAADDLLDEIEANDKRRAAELAEQWREHAHRDGAPPAWRAVVAKVDAGELTWHDIASGNAMDDPAVRAAIATDEQPREKPEAGQPKAPTRAASDDDTYFEDHSVLRKRKR